MIKTVEQKTESIPLKLPEGFWGVLSHTANIDYCIKQIREHSNNGYVLVVGYRIAGLPIAGERNHRLISKEEAEKKEKTNPRFEYITLDKLLRKKEDIGKGMYEINENGHIWGFSDWYRKKMGYT